jgi:protein-L-isoaspartate O-methyltransferase
VDTTVESTSPDRLRADLAAHLTAKGWTRTPAVERAFRTVPRHLFVPDTVGLEQAYADEIVATKRGPDGKTTSSVSAPWVSLSTLIVLRTSGRKAVLPISDSLIVTEEVAVLVIRVS